MNKHASVITINNKVM